MLGINSQGLTRATQEVIALAGTVEPFEPAAKVTLVKLAGIRRSPSSVERTTQEAGQLLEKNLEENKPFGAEKPWEWNRDWEDQSCAYIALDATGIGIQGEGATKAEGKQVKVAMIFNPHPRSQEEEPPSSRPCQQARYLAGHYDLSGLGERLRTEAGQVGVSQADRQIALSDGGSGFENWVDVHFPLAVKIMDFFHVSEYLCELSKQYVPENWQAQWKEWRDRLEERGGSRLHEELLGLDEESMSPECQEFYRTTLVYFGNHKEKMKYPEYLGKGWQIGSGAVESACKRLVNGRLCRTGMRWKTKGSQAVCHLRALLYSDTKQWDAFWAQTLTAA